MSWKIGMPNLGHTMEEGKVSEWLKAVGDRVSKGEVIAVGSGYRLQDGTVKALDVKKGDKVVLVAGNPLGQRMNLVQALTVT